jgi:hypothetical protein
MRQYRRIERVRLALVCVLLGPGLLAGCGLEKPIEDALASIKDSFDGPPPPRAAAAIPSPRRPKPRAESATAQAGRCHDVPSCETMLRKMTDGSDRSWITRPETPEGLLTGVRMFALRTLRPKLTCDELGAALEQLRGVPAALRPPPAGSSPEDITRTTRLAAEVHDELRAENEARCRGPATPSSRPPAPAPQPAPAQPPASGQPAAPKQPSTTTQPQAPSQPTVTTQPPAAPQKPQVTIPDQPQGKQ